jgi:hypothetical protein
MKLRYAFLALPILGGVSIIASAAASAQGVQAFAAMFGGNETAAADTDGYGAAAFTFHGKTEICFGIVVDKIGTPTAAHIHPGKAGETGPPLVTLTHPTSGNPGASSGCTDVSSDTFNAIRNSPSDFYINVHNAEFPGGAIRGQLF